MKTWMEFNKYIKKFLILIFILRMEKAIKYGILSIELLQYELKLRGTISSNVPTIKNHKKLNRCVDEII